MVESIDMQYLLKCLVEVGGLYLAEVVVDHIHPIRNINFSFFFQFIITTSKDT